MQQERTLGVLGSSRNGIIENTLRLVVTGHARRIEERDRRVHEATHGLNKRANQHGEGAGSR